MQQQQDSQKNILQQTILFHNKKQIHLNQEEQSLNQEEQSLNQEPSSTTSHQPKLAFSKYDFVKVRVYINDKHYYVLSRFLVSRVLTAAQVEFAHAVRISLDLKKFLVDKSMIECTQNDLEIYLFHIMKKHGYGVEHIRNYRMMSSFHHNRTPLIIFITGTCCVGKSTLASCLSERLNLPSVLSTDLMYEILCDIYGGVSPKLPFWLCGEGSSALVEAYDTECGLVEKVLYGDLNKCVSEGKSVIVEGIHVSISTIANFVAHVRKNVEKKVIVVPFIIKLKSKSVHLEWIKRWLSRQEKDVVKRFNESRETVDGLHEKFSKLQSHLIRKNLLNDSICHVCYYDDENSLNILQNKILREIEKC